MPSTRNGAKGISLLIVRCLNAFGNLIVCTIDKDIYLNMISATPTAAPIQKAKTIAEIPAGNPKLHPIPNANLASPNPIHFPEEKNHSEKKNRKIAKPVIMSQIKN